MISSSPVKALSGSEQPGLAVVGLYTSPVAWKVTISGMMNAFTVVVELPAVTFSPTIVKG